MPKAKKMQNSDNKASISRLVRRQVLSTDGLLDVFGYVDRHTLDDANVVSFDYNAMAQRAPPLRSVKYAHFYHNAEHQTFYVNFYYDPPGTDTWTNNERKALEMVASNMEEAVAMFFRCIRFCNVAGPIRFLYLEIPQLFVDQLKVVAKEFLCKSENVDFAEVAVANGVHAMDLLLAFPSFRALNESSLDLLKESVGNSDGMLKVAASRGAFYLFGNSHLANHRISEAAILDYAFGDYNDKGEVRKLGLTWPALSKKFLINLVQACLERRREVKIDLKITITRDLAVDELVANGEKHLNDDGSYAWLFRFDNLPELNIEYKPPYAWRDGELRCWGRVHGNAKHV